MENKKNQDSNSKTNNQNHHDEYKNDQNLNHQIHNKHNDNHNDNNKHSGKQSHEKDHNTSNDIKVETDNNHLTENDKLENRIKELESENASIKDKALRTLADCENTKKRLQREKDDAVSYANKAILKDLLPSLDSLDLAISTTKDEDIKKGIELVRTTFLTALRKWGLEVIDDKGKEYDPNRHEACLFEVNPEAKEETILETLQKGYTLHSIVIRPSKVKVEKCE